MRLFGEKPMTKCGVIPYERCPAKSCADGRAGTSVFDHCRYAGAVAERLADLLPSKTRGFLPDALGFLVALHDIGKVSPGFQGKYFSGLLATYAPDWLRRLQTCNTDHASVGADAYVKIARVEKNDAVALAIARHHGEDRRRSLSNCDSEHWQKERLRLVNALAAAFGVSLERVAAERMEAGLIAGITCVADWIASNETYFPAEAAPIPSAQLSGHVARVLSDIGFSHLPFRAGLAFGDLFQRDGFRYSPRCEQQSLMDAVNVPGVYVMEASMGAGKTEAALFAAYALIAAGHNSGIYFALPTRLTSDRIYRRMQEFLNRATQGGVPVRLSHGRAWLSGYQVGGVGKDGHDLPSWFSPSKRGLLYPYAVGTIDQALLAAMNVRHSFVRLYGLAGKVVILDEVHSYDMYTGSLVEALVRDLRKIGCTVIVLSATLTRAKRDVLLGCETPAASAYPLVAGNVDGQLVLHEPHVDTTGKRVSLRRIEGKSAVVAEALAQARKGCNVLCVANTVRQAQDWYWELKSQMNEGDTAHLRTGLLHSRFPDFQRAVLEDRWMEALGKDGTNRPHGSILISTQIVEQSVDIDADCLITEIAPIDMLFQRMGRLWRHDRENRPTPGPSCVLAFDGRLDSLSDFTEESFRTGVGAGCFVYAPYVLLQTLRVLDGRDEVSIPGDMRPLLESVYAERSENTGSAAAAMKAEMEETRREMESAARAAEAHVTSLPTRDDSEDAPPTRYGSRKTVPLLLLRSVDLGVGHGQAAFVLLDGSSVRVSSVRPDFVVTKSLYANVVAVPMSNALGRISREEERRLLALHFHVGEMPLLCRVEADGRLTLAMSGEASGLAYREDVGVFDSSRLSADGAVSEIEDDQPFDLGGADW